MGKTVNKFILQTKGDVYQADNHFHMDFYFVYYK